MNKLQSDSGFFDLMHKFYAAVFYFFFAVWKSEQKTIRDTGFVLERMSTVSPTHNCSLNG